MTIFASHHHAMIHFCSILMVIINPNNMKKLIPNLQSKWCHGISALMLLCLPLTAMSQTSIEPLGLSFDTENYSVSCNLGVLTEEITTANGSATASMLSPTVPMRLEGVYTAVNNVEVENIKVWPNPVTDFIMVRTENSIRSFSITDISGKIQITQNGLNENEITILTSQLKAGNYILQIETIQGTKYSGLFLKK